MNLYDLIINKVPGNQFFTGTVATITPSYTVKIYADDTAITCKPLTHLLNIKVGSNVILMKVLNQFLILAVIDDICSIVGDLSTAQSTLNSTITANSSAASAAISTANSNITVAYNANSSAASSAYSKAVVASTAASTADSKAVAASTAASTADSKAVVASNNIYNDIMMINLNSNQTITGTTQTKVQFNNEKSSHGSRLTFDDDNYGIKIGAGISHVLILLDLWVQSDAGCYVSIHIKKNSTELTYAIIPSPQSGDQPWHSIHTSATIDVAENDLIYGYVRFDVAHASYNVVAGDYANSCNLIVKTIA